MKKLLSVLLIGLMVFSFAACGGEAEVEEVAEVSNLVGSWTGMYGDDGSNIMSEPNQLTLVFTEDGKGTLTYFTSKTDFEWVEEGGKVTCTYLDEDFVSTYGLETYKATIEGDVLSGGHLYGFDFIVAKDGTEAADPSLYGEDK